MAASDRDIRISFLPRLLIRSDNPRDQERTRIHSLLFRPPPRRGTVNRIGKLLIGVEWPFRNGKLAGAWRLIPLDELHKPFLVHDNYSGAEVQIHPEDLAPLMVAIDDAMERVG